MSLPANIPTPILETVLGRLALLFLPGADNNLVFARDAARHMLEAYQIKTEQELLLATEIISFSLHALEALSQASSDDMPLARIIRLRSGAVSLNREAHRSRQKLEQLQRDRLVGVVPLEAETIAYPDTVAGPSDAAPSLITPTRCSTSNMTQSDPNQARPAIDKALGAVEAAREVLQTAARQKDQGKYGGMTWSQAYQKRQAAQAIAATAKRRQAEHAARLAEQPVHVGVEAAPVG